jgi:predicted RNA binding protein YcfA (HicA-like mRNA interferase family)
MKLPQISGKELIKILSKFGFKVVRQRGSHVRLEKKTNGKIIKITVPMHPNLKRGTLSRIIKDSKVNEDEFAEFI